jgi:hypothetical protein
MNHYYLFLLTGARPWDKSTAPVILVPLEHFPSPSKVVTRVIDYFPIPIFCFNIIEPDLVDLKGASVMAIPSWMAIDNV